MQYQYSPTVTIAPTLARQMRVGIIRSLFNSELTVSLERACRACLVQSGVAERRLATFTVPGALEIPVTARALAATNHFDILVALGVVIKGDTYHFELVANECARGCMDVALQSGVPVIMEVLASYSLDQAKVRCADDEYNKGYEAATAALQTYATLVEIKNYRV